MTPNLTEQEFRKWMNIGQGNISTNNLFKFILDKVSKLYNNEIVVDFKP